MRKFRFLISTVVLSVLGLFLASCSFGPQTKIEKIRGAYGSIMLDYNTKDTNYQAMIPLRDLIPNFKKPDHTNVITVTFDYYAFTKFDDIRVRLVSNSPAEPQGTWTDLSTEKKLNGSTGLDIADTGNFTHTFQITTISPNTDLSKYFLVITSELRSGESSTNHESALEFFANPSAIQTDLYASLAGGKVIIEDVENNGFRITLFGTDDNYWTDKRYEEISVEPGINISVSGDNQRPSGSGDSRVIYYPFVNPDTSYKFHFDGEDATLWTDNSPRYGEVVGLNDLKNIELTTPVAPYPIARIKGLDSDVLTAPIANIGFHFSASYEITFWGSAEYDDWLYAISNSVYDDYEDVAFNLVKLSGSEDTSKLDVINRTEAWWYSFTYRITSSNFSGCSWIYTKGSDKCYLSQGETLTDENTYFKTHAAKEYYGPYLRSEITNSYFIPVTTGDTYKIEWVDSFNADKPTYWEEYPVPNSWRTIWKSDLSNNGDDHLYVDYSDDGNAPWFSKADTDNGTELEFTADADGYIDVHSDSGYGFFHIYKTN